MKEKTPLFVLSDAWKRLQACVSGLKSFSGSNIYERNYLKDLKEMFFKSKELFLIETSPLLLPSI